jgi:hypothetical protein
VKSGQQVELSLYQETYTENTAWGNQASMLAFPHPQRLANTRGLATMCKHHKGKLGARTPRGRALTQIRGPLTSQESGMGAKSLRTTRYLRLQMTVGCRKRSKWWGRWGHGYTRCLGDLHTAQNAQSIECLQPRRKKRGWGDRQRRNSEKDSKPRSFIFHPAGKKELSFFSVAIMEYQKVDNL